MNPPPAYTFQSLQRRADNKRFAEMEAELMPTLTALRLDQRRSTYVGRKGDLVCFLIEVEQGARKKEPALLLTNRANPKERSTYLVLNELWRLVDPEIPDDPVATRLLVGEQQRALRDMAQMLYGFVTRDDCTRVLDAVFEFAEDLKNAKPPTWMTHGQWLQALAEDDMTLIHSGVALNR